jgi:hypothetical protein
MPQTINGEPYAPGQKPNDGTVPTGQPQQAPPQAPDAGADDDSSFGGDDLSEKPKKDGGDDGDSGGDKPNPFAKKDDSGSDDSSPSKESMLITEAGVALPLEEYMAYLALRVTPDKDQTLAEVQRQHHREV